MNLIQTIIDDLKDMHISFSISELKDIDFTQAPKEIEDKIRKFYRKKLKNKYSGKKLKKKLDDIVYRIMNKMGLLKNKKK